MHTLEAVSSVANQFLLMKSLIKNRDSHFQICNVFFVSKGNLFDVYSVGYISKVAGIGNKEKCLHSIWNSTFEMS